MTTRSGGTKIDVREARRSLSLVLRRDAASDPQSPILGARIVGEVGKNVIVLSDTVQSRPSGRLAYCQSGEETTVRMLVVRAKGLAQTAHWKVDSCIDGIEASAPPPHLDGDTLTINWLHAPIAGKRPGALKATIAPDGSVRGSVEPG